MAAHGHPRYTGDLDLWVWTAVQNAESLLTALGDFGFGSVGLGPGRLHRARARRAAGLPTPPDHLLASTDGVEFETCFDRRVEIVVDGLPVPFIALDDLRRNKAASGRPQDIADLVVESSVVVIMMVEVAEHDEVGRPAVNFSERLRTAREAWHRHRRCARTAGASLVGERQGRGGEVA